MSPREMRVNGSVDTHVGQRSAGEGELRISVRARESRGVRYVRSERRARRWYERRHLTWRSSHASTVVFRREQQL